ncbi:MAG: hydantoinase B/oxoprolinase family protein [Azospirillaceae bacterium]
MREGIDPIRLEVLRNAFDTIADEMALILMRTAYSAIVRDAMDFSTAICDAQGRTLAQGLTTPLHLGSFYDALSHLIRQYGHETAPGDIFIANDPYTASSQHLPDIYIIHPVFAGDALCGWSTTLAHHADVGGIIPGSNALGAKEIYQEGLRLPFLKLYEAGRLNHAIWKIIETNVRVPDLVLGDLEAQIVGARTGADKLLDLVGTMGLSDYEHYVDVLHDYAETLARREIADIPDGLYRFEDEIDGLGEAPDPIRLRVAVTVVGDTVSIDWSGTSAQVEGGINAPIPFTRAAAYTAIRSVMASDVPNCHGYTRPIEVVAPAGTVVNPVEPAACGARGITGFRMIDCLFGALAQACPDRVAADGNGGSSLPTFAGRRDGRASVFSETLMGNWGGTAAHDGQDGVAHMGANQSNVPVELIELDYPIRIEQYALVPDTGGPGRHRGGLAIVRDYRMLADDMLVSIRSDKRAFPPHGLFGGAAGEPSASLINPGTPGERAVPVLVIDPITLRRGDLFRHQLAGAGGHGSALDRDPEAVLQDLVLGRVSVRHAEEAYGVVLECLSPMRIDAAATRDRRATMREAEAASGPLA